MKPALRRRALRAALYCVGLFAFFEISARAALAVPSLFKRVAWTCAAAWRLEWVGRKQHEGGAYAFDVYQPTRGWALRPNMEDWKVFDEGLLSSNSKGLRGRREYAYARRPGVTRLEVFGDSFTFGEDVGDNATYPAQLQRLLGDGVEVLNFGVHGYGHDQMLLYLQEEGIRYHPDVVILGFVDWDMERNLLEFRDFAKPRFELADEGLLLRNSPVPPPTRVLEAEAYRSRFVDLLGMLDYAIRRRLGWSRADAERLTAALLDAFRRSAEAAGAKLVIAYLPVEEEMKPSPGATTPGESFVARYCAARGVSSIDLRTAFLARQSRGERFRASGHWTRREHRVAAEALRAGLAEAQLLP